MGFLRSILKFFREEDESNKPYTALESEPKAKTKTKKNTQENPEAVVPTAKKREVSAETRAKLSAASTAAHARKKAEAAKAAKPAKTTQKATK